jgi:hypothetical protein
MTVRSLVAMAALLLAASPAWAQDGPDPGAPAPAPAPVPAMSIDSLEHQAGEVAPGSTISHDFLVKNLGEAELRLGTDGNPGCGCLVASFPRSIPPGSQGVITLTMDVYREWAGHYVNKTALIVTNDPASPTARLTMRAKVAAIPES